MMFYVYMQPEVIRDAQNDGPYAVQALISFLRGSLQNCCLVGFQDDRTRSAIKDNLDAFPEEFDRKLLKSLFSSLQKRNRFLYVLTPDHTGIRSDLELVLAAATTLQIDIILLESEGDTPNTPAGVEVCQLATYQNTNFEHARFQLAGEGKTLAEGEHGQREYLDRYWGKVFRYSNRIEICDRIMGQRFGDNFEYSVRILFQWLESTLSNPAECSMVMHLGVPDKASLNHIQTQLAAFRRGRLVAMPIEIHIYDVPSPDQCLPHERFILTDQIALEIGRGMDFIDRATGRNRDISIGYKSHRDVTALLQSYAAYKQQPITKF